MLVGSWAFVDSCMSVTQSEVHHSTFKRKAGLVCIVRCDVQRPCIYLTFTIDRRIDHLVPHLVKVKFGWQLFEFAEK